MFFSSKVTNISRNAKVLEIGPGGAPFYRSDVFLDLDPTLFKDEVEAGYQRGNAPVPKIDKPIVYYDGKRFPFMENEFDYVVCSHVLEHVENPEEFVKEVCRVAPRGYFEFPTIFYEYLYDIPVHLNICYFDEHKIRYMKKSDMPFNYFSSVQSFFLQSLECGYDDIVKDLKEYMFQGFEWDGSIKIQNVSNIGLLSEFKQPLPSKKYYEKGLEEYSIKQLANITYGKIRTKLKKITNRDHLLSIEERSDSN